MKLSEKMKTLSSLPLPPRPVQDCFQLITKVSVTPLW
jgi:hypothetical protein